MADPTNPADVPEVLRQPYPGHPKPPAYQREVARRVKNRRHVKVVDMAEVLEKGWTYLDQSPEMLLHTLPEQLASASDHWWSDLASAAGHPSTKPPSPKTRAAVIQKVRENLAR